MHVGCYVLMHFVLYWTQLILAINPDYHGSNQHCKSCSGLINIFKESLFTSARCFQLCLCPACSSSPLPPKLLFVLCPQHRYVLYLWTHSVFSLCSCQCRNDIYRGTLFRPLQFFCKVRYVNWPVLPFQSRCMCCMCAANRIIHSVSNPSLLMKYCCLLTTSQNHSSLGQYGLKDTDIFLNNFYLSTITQVMYWFMLFRKVINHFVSL